MRKLLILLCPLFYFIFVPNFFSQSPIQPTGGPYPVAAKQFAFKPGGIVFLGTQEKGVFRSTDSGNSWKDVSNVLNSLYGVECIAVGPEGNIYAGYEFGFFHSTNNGDTWINSPAGVGNGVKCIAVDPDSGHIYAGNNDGVYKSTDKGNNWFKVQSESSIMAVVIDAVGNHIYAGGANGVYVSDNNGKSWYKTNNYTGDQITALAIDSKGVLYIGDMMGGLFKSNDKGMSCFPLINDIGLASAVSTLAINPDDYVYIGTLGYGIYCSTDNGANWAKLINGLRTQSMENISVSPEGYLFAGARYGYIYRSTNKGQNWEQLQLCKPVAQLYQNLVEKLLINSEGDIFAIAGDWFNSKGIYRSADKAKTWYECVNNLNNLSLNSAILDTKGNLFVSTGHGFFKSTDKGDSWITIVSENIPAFYNMVSNSKGEIFGLTTLNELYVSTDNGKSWKWVNHDFGQNDVKSFVMTPNDHMFIATPKVNGIYKSTDSGVSWKQLDSSKSGLNNLQYVDLLASDSKGQLFAGISEPDYCYRSTDDGETWTKINSGIESTTVYAIGSDGKGKVILCGSQDIFVSENNGDSWTKIENPEENLNIQTVAFHPNGQAFMGTARGVYTFVDSLMTSVEIENSVSPAAYMLEQNYPNPFNPSTVISYQIPQAAKVTLKVYNIIGKEIATLVNGYQSEGKHSVRFNASGLPSGMYIYELRANESSTSRKMLLIR